MMGATELFVGSLEKWLRAVRASDLAAAKFHAEHIQLHGELLAIHPEFRRAFAARWPEVDPDDALQQFTRFLMCATELRERALGEQRAATTSANSWPTGGRAGKEPEWREQVLPQEEVL